ncbi:MAG: hypothetical protein ACOCQA_01880 [bacterium]
MDKKVVKNIILTLLFVILFSLEIAKIQNPILAILSILIVAVLLSMYVICDFEE